MTDASMFTTIPFAKIPRQTRLFLEYLEPSPAALSFYQRPPTLAAMAELAGARLSGFSFPRREIASVLRRQNERFGADADARRNIDNLEKEDCFAVMTGQQVGLFGGPLYTIYKAFTALRVVERLRVQNIRAVPIFWLDTDDHDLAEVTRCTVAGPDSPLRSMDGRPLLFGTTPDSSQPVGSIELPEAIGKVVDEYFSGLPDTQWKVQARARLESAYRPGVSFAEAFGRLMAGLFAGYGLVFFDPRDVDAKRMTTPVFQRALREDGHIHDALTARIRELEEAGFHAQVGIQENSTVLFLEERGQRRALVREGPQFALKGGQLRFPLDQLVETAGKSPEHFSPSVLLRPVVQDFLFPTVCYVGGPGEIAYFAQAEVLYRLFERPMPIIWPRSSLTLLSMAEAETMRQFGLALEDCFQGRNRLLEKMLQASGDALASSILARTQDDISRAFDELLPAVAATEGSLGPAMDTAKRKIFHHLQTLGVKFLQSEARRNSELAHKAKVLIDTCYPGGNLQERELGICPFLSRSGPGILDAIYSLVKTDSFSHRVAVVSP
jgi:bacillithiol biosynthesis cysteine-adding enzyme BshC